MLSKQFQTAFKVIKCRNNIWFLRQCRKLGLIPTGIRARNVLKNTFNSKKTEELTDKHSRQWRQLALNLEYEKLYRISETVFPLPLHEHMKLQELHNNLEKRKIKKLMKLYSTI